MRHQQKKFRILFLAIFLIVIFCFDHTSNGNPKAQAAKVEKIKNRNCDSWDQASQPQKWALLIGINKYQLFSGRKNLDGCVADIEAIKEILTSQSGFAFPMSNIKTLLDEQATKINIEQTVENFLLKNDQIKNDDIILIYYSGHGTQVPDRDENEEPDGMDEAIVPHDACGELGVITDDQIGGWLRQLNLRTKNLIIIFDSCHSGSATRDAFSKPRFVSFEDIENKFRGENTPTKGGDRASDWFDEGVGYAFISGCMHHENSQEFKTSDGKQRGVLSYYLDKALLQMKTPLTYRELMDRIKDEIEGTKYGKSQHPVVEWDLDKLVMSGVTVPRRTFFNILEIDGMDVKIDAGAVHLITPGSILAVYPREAGRNVTAEECVTKLEVISVSSTTSNCRILTESSGISLSRNNRIPKSDEKKDLRVSMLSHNFGDLNINVCLDKVKNKTLLEKLKKKILDLPFAKLSPDSVAEVFFTKNGETMHGPLIHKMCENKLNPQDEDYLCQIETELLRVAQIKNLSELEHPYTSLVTQNNSKKVIDVKIIKVEVEDGEIVKKIPLDTQTGDRIELKVGDGFIIKITNNFLARLWINILDMKTDGGVGLIFPYRGAQDNQIPPGVSVELPRYGYYRVDEPLGLEKLKVIATTKQTPPLEAAEMPGCTQDKVITRSGGLAIQAPLAMLFANPLSAKTRANIVVPSDWTTETVRFEVVNAAK